MSDSDVVQTILASRAFNYLALQSVFGDVASPILVETLKSDAAYQSFEIYLEGDDTSYAETLRAADDVLKAMDLTSKATLDSLKSEYTRLFLGPNDLDAPPWESMYTSSLHSLFQEATLEVRNCYRVQGFLPAEHPHVADDHIALEFAFLAQLGNRAQAAYAEADFNAAESALVASQQFLDEHLLVWLPRYASDLEGSEGAKFYPIMAKLALGFSKADKSVLEGLLDELKENIVRVE
jgi:TorA maturation chaperone TorD